MQPCAKALRQSGQQTDKMLPVGFVSKDGASLVPAGGQMIARTGLFQSQRPSHAPMLSEPYPLVKYRDVTPMRSDQLLTHHDDGFAGGRPLLFHRDEG